MKKLITLITFILLSAVYVNVHASTFSNPYVGLEAMKTNIAFKGSYGDNLFAKNPLYYNFFTGINFSDIFGVEAGWGIQGRKKRTTTIYRGQSLGGASLQDDADVAEYKSSLKSRQVYLGLFAETCPFENKNFRAKLFVGLSTVNLDAWFYPEKLDGVLLDHANRQSGRVVHVQNKVVPIVKATFMHYLTDNVKLGVSASYRNLARIKSFGESAAYDSEISLKDAFSVGLRLSYILIKNGI